MQIVVHNPDIFCLHEVDSKVFKENIQPALTELRYSIVQYTRACRGNQDFARVTCIFAKGKKNIVCLIFFCSSMEICKKYVLSNSEECIMRSSGAMTMSHIVLDTSNVFV